MENKKVNEQITDEILAEMEKVPESVRVKGEQIADGLSDYFKTAPAMDRYRLATALSALFLENALVAANDYAVATTPTEDVDKIYSKKMTVMAEATVSTISTAVNNFNPGIVLKLMPAALAGFGDMLSQLGEHGSSDTMN